MDINLSNFRIEERVVFQMRRLFEQYGYTRFKMNRFEQYDLYIRNRDFLISDRMITFTDVDGTLLALKPDVTISIIKNSVDIPGFVNNLYYNENVYRSGKNDSSFRELMQSGLECIGDVDIFKICEVITLAAKSLSIISSEYILDLSHLGLISGIMAALSIPQEYYNAVLQCVREKNISELTRICDQLSLDNDAQNMLSALVLTYGDMESVLFALEKLQVNKEITNAVNELRLVFSALQAQGLEKNVRIDFSLVNDLNYYNGIVFQGFIKGVSTQVLSGGQYDRLMQKMGKKSRAIGFAVYLDTLNQLSADIRTQDIDLLILYDDATPIQSVFTAMERYTSSGQTVSTAKTVPDYLSANTILDLRKGGADA